jgi:hypothetical protein
MQVIMTRQISLPVFIQDPKENVVVDIENNHVELTLGDNSILIIPSIDAYYSFIADSEVYNENDIFLDKLFRESKITFVNYKLREGIDIKTVCESKYNDEPIWLLRI